MTPADPPRFVCTPRGRIRASRRRLTLLLFSLLLVMLAASTLMFWQGRTIPALLCLLVGFGVWMALRMSSDLDPLWIDVLPQAVRVQMRRQHKDYPYPNSARRIDGEQIRHLERLITTAGFTLSTGGYDSSRLGEFDLFATDLSRSVLLAYDESGVIVTPDDPEAFLRALPVASPPAPSEDESLSDTIHIP